MWYWFYIFEWLGDWWIWYKLIEGEFCFGLVFGVIVFLGVGVGYEILSYFVYDYLIVFVLIVYEVWVIFGVVIGVIVVFYLLCGQFGYCGGVGVVIVIKGVFGVMFLGSLIGGMLVMLVFGIMFGFFVFMMLFVIKLVVGLMWVGSLLVVYILMWGWWIECDD